MRTGHVCACADGHFILESTGRIASWDIGTRLRRLGRRTTFAVSTSNRSRSPTCSLNCAGTLAESEHERITDDLSTYSYLGSGRHGPSYYGGGGVDGRAITCTISAPACLSNPSRPPNAAYESLPSSARHSHNYRPGRPTVTGRALPTSRATSPSGGERRPPRGLRTPPLAARSRYSTTISVETRISKSSSASTFLPTISIVRDPGVAKASSALWDRRRSPSVHTSPSNRRS